ncbi:MAG TPA: hypothetical protein VD815_05750 [Candidatus Saccharimonadales bacterium]|nr:hypothetical protein [Candidatus Saccharimonadales bacterium]
MESFGYENQSDDDKDGVYFEAKESREDNDLSDYLAEEDTSFGISDHAEIYGKDNIFYYRCKDPLCSNQRYKSTNHPSSPPTCNIHNILMELIE